MARISESEPKIYRLALSIREYAERLRTLCRWVMAMMRKYRSISAMDWTFCGIIQGGLPCSRVFCQMPPLGKYWMRCSGHRNGVAIWMYPARRSPIGGAQGIGSQ